MPRSCPTSPFVEESVVSALLGISVAPMGDPLSQGEDVHCVLLSPRDVTLARMGAGKHEHSRRLDPSEDDSRERCLQPTLVGDGCIVRPPSHSIVGTVSLTD